MTPHITGTTRRVPFLDLVAQQAEVADVVFDQWRDLFAAAEFVGGPHVDAFEREYAAYLGAGHVVGVANGTDALELAYRAVGIAPGDEVIVPVNTFIATAEAVSRVGAVPVFVDVDPDTLLIDPDAVTAAITRRTRAIVPVHLFGQTAPVELLRPIADRYDLALVEDAAQAQGARSLDGAAGTLGDIAATSFYPGKNLGAAGDAGAVITQSAALAEQVRVTAAHGSSRKYVHDRVGLNSRLDAMQAVVLRAKLRRLDVWNTARGAVARRYNAGLNRVGGLRVPVPRAGNFDVWHLYVVRVDERDRVAGELAEAGIGTGIHYPTPLHLTAAYAYLGYPAGAFPVAERAAARLLSLPMSPHLEIADQQRVIEVLRRALGAD